MPVEDSDLLALMRLIASGDTAAALEGLTRSAGLATKHMTTGASRQGPDGYYLDTIGRYVYAGHTALHVAAAAYLDEIVRALIAAGADVRARNRRGTEPLHEAAVGGPGSHHWNPGAQSAAIRSLMGAGADANATDKDGATPLHRAARTRCAEAVSTLLEVGADPHIKNKGGSTALRLAKVTSGRGGTGSTAAKDQQAEILGLLQRA